MTAIRPAIAVINALAGPSRLRGRPGLIASESFRHSRSLSNGAASFARPQYSQAEPLRRISNTAKGLYSYGVQRDASIRRPASQQLRSYTSFPPSAPRPAISPRQYPLLALAPLTSSLPTDPVDPSTTSSFLDPLVALLLSSPLPAGLTILLLTFSFRSAITLPATLWQRRRMQRTKEIVRPAMKAINEQLAGKVARECRAKGLGYEEYKKELKSQLAVHQSALHKKYGTHPLATMILPLFVHIPLIITLSLSIRRAIEAPFSPWAAESWWWLQHLGEVDPTFILPIMGGVVGMMNAEVIGRRNKDLGEALEVGPEGGVVKDTGRVVSSAETGRETVASSIAPQPLPSAPQPTATAKSGTATRTPTLPPHLSKSTRSPQMPSRPLSTSSIIRSSPPTPTPRPARKSPIPTPTPRPATPSKRPIRPLPPSASSSSSSGPRLQPITAIEEQTKEVDKARLTSKLFAMAMRAGAVLFIPIAMQVPAALALYWTASMVFTLGQNLTLDWLDARAKARKAV